VAWTHPLVTAALHVTLHAVRQCAHFLGTWNFPALSFTVALIILVAIRIYPLDLLQYPLVQDEHRME